MEDKGRFDKLLDFFLTEETTWMQLLIRLILPVQIHSGIWTRPI